MSQGLCGLAGPTGAVGSAKGYLRGLQWGEGPSGTIELSKDVEVRTRRYRVEIMQSKGNEFTSILKKGTAF